MRSKIYLFLALILCACASLYAVEKPVGTIVDAAGNAWIEADSGKKKAATKGSDIFNGDILYAGNQSYLEVEMFDGSTMKLTGDSKIIVEDVVVDPNSKVSRMEFITESGRYNFSSGKIGKIAPEQFKFHTPHAQVKLHGSEFTAHVNKDSTSIVGNGIKVKQKKKNIADIVNLDKEGIKSNLALFKNASTSTVTFDPEGDLCIVYFSDDQSGQSIITEISYEGKIEQKGFEGSLQGLYHQYLMDTFNGHIPKNVQDQMQDLEKKFSSIDSKYFSKVVGEVSAGLNEKAAALSLKIDSLSEDELREAHMNFLVDVIKGSMEIDRAAIEFRMSLVRILPSDSIRDVRLRSLEDVERFNEEAYITQIESISQYKQARVATMQESVIEDLRSESQSTKIEAMRMEAKELAEAARAFSSEDEEAVASSLLNASQKVLEKVEKMKKGN